MDHVAERIFTTNAVIDDEGKSHPLHSQTVKEQAEHLQEAIRTYKPKISLEIGLAYGLSTLFICEALKEVGAQKHIVMDPFQKKYWSNIGLKNIKDAGYQDLVDFYPDFSHVILPELLKADTQIDFAYVDTTKLFDVVFVDVYYLAMLLKVGGILFIDDCAGRGIRKVCRFMARHPSWEVVKLIGKSKSSFKYNSLNKVARCFPKGEKIFANNVYETDKQLGVNAHCIGFRKVKEDDRHWSWHKEF